MPSTAAFDLGFERERLVVAGVEPLCTATIRARAAVYLARLLDRTRSLPGVVDVAVADRVPFYIGYTRTMAVAPARVDLSRRRPARRWPRSRLGPTDCSATMSAPALALAGSSTTRRPARRAKSSSTRRLPDSGGRAGDGLGRHAERWGRSRPRTSSTGIVGDIRQRLGSRRGRQRPTAGSGPRSSSRSASDQLTASHDRRANRWPGGGRSSSPMLDAAGAGRSQHPRALHPDDGAAAWRLPLWPFKTLRGLFSVCGLLALVLATVGLAGVVSHAVSRRIREFGVRRDWCGTTRSRDRRHPQRRGDARSWADDRPHPRRGNRQARDAPVRDLDPWNLPAYVVVAALQSTVVVLACLRPALRAARVDPMTALRA